ncbi:MAG: Fur family transcriptional regulator [Anaerolineales bacterium]|jgi:Fur family ferric uptake transcriptional regulator
MSHCHTIVAELKKRGYRITPQREMIIETIAHSSHHVTVDEIVEQLRTHTSTINIATVYRTLELLWQEGFACRNDLSEGKSVFATYQHGPHIHLVCRKCNRVIDGDSRFLAELGEKLREAYNFQPDLDHFSIFGLCSECLE